jgi:hypothetical protein
MLGVKSLNEITWLLTSGNNIYTLWTQIKDQWLSGNLMGKDGDSTGQKRDDNTLTINMVKRFEGITEPEFLKDLLTKVLEGKCVLMQSKDYTKLPLVSTLTQSYKVQQELQKEILKHCQVKWEKELGVDCSWEDLAGAIPVLDSVEELTRIENALTFDYISSLISKSKSVPNPPTSLTARVDTLVSQHFGLKRRTRIEPYRIIMTLNHG